MRLAVPYFINNLQRGGFAYRKTIASHLSKLAVEPMRITTEDLRLPQNPDNLHGKQFILSSDADSDDSGRMRSLVTT
jgi:hypothetical protein